MDGAGPAAADPLAGCCRARRVFVCVPCPGAALQKQLGGKLHQSGKMGRGLGLDQELPCFPRPC